MQKPTELARAFWQPRWQHSMGFRVSGWVFCVRVCVSKALATKIYSLLK